MNLQQKLKQKIVSKIFATKNLHIWISLLNYEHTSHFSLGILLKWYTKRHYKEEFIKNEAERRADTFISNEQHCSPIYPKVVAKTHDFLYLVYMYVLQVGIFCSSVVFRSMAAKKTYMCLRLLRSSCMWYKQRNTLLLVCFHEKKTRSFGKKQIV